MGKHLLLLLLLVQVDAGQAKDNVSVSLHEPNCGCNRHYLPNNELSVRCVNASILCLSSILSSDDLVEVKLEHLDEHRLDLGQLLSTIGAKVSQLRLVSVTNSSIGAFHLCSSAENENLTDENDHYNGPSCSSFSEELKIDLRDNLLTSLNFYTLPQNATYLLSGNPWSCYEDPVSTYYGMSWLLNSNVIDKRSSKCAKPRSNKWHQQTSDAILFYNVTLIHFLKFSQGMEQACPTLCHCDLVQPPLWVRVSCTNVSLTELPVTMPENVMMLDVSFNQIKSLNALATNPYYVHLKQLVARCNALVSMSELLNAPLMRNEPTKLDLRDNLITHFDTGVLDPVFSVSQERHFQGSLNFLLSGNPFSCLCDSFFQLQNFVYKYQVLLKDAPKLACGPEQSPLMIRASVEDVCPEPESFDVALIVIFIELVLLTLVLAKLSYDIWHYRSSGQLPWLARHICLGYSYHGLKSTEPKASSKGRVETKVLLAEEKLTESKELVMPRLTVVRGVSQFSSSPTLSRLVLEKTWASSRNSDLMLTMESEPQPL